MNKGMALLATAVFVAMAMSGCTSGSKGGFTIKAPAAAGGEYVFTANGKADNYTWDLGDRLSVAYGKTVHHTYDFKDGNITVILTQKTGATSEEHRQSLVLGTGKNAVPTFILEAPRNWTIPGEQMFFTATHSSDPDHDPLRYTWSCVRSADAVRLPTHVHPGFGGVAFATPPAGTVTSLTFTGAAPKTDRVVPGDLCESLGSGGKPSKDATISGTFTKTGIYDVYLLASDPVHPTTSGKYHFVVTKPEERPAPVVELTFNKTLQGGSGGSVQSFCTTVPGCTGDYDAASHAFTLPLTGKQGYITSTFTSSDPLANLTWVLKRGTLEVARSSTNGANVTLAAADMKASAYSVDVTLGGASTSYVIKVHIPLDLDPFKVY